MKILHVNKFFDYHGGAAVYLHRLMEAQRAAGHQVHALSTRDDKNRPSTDQKYFVERLVLNRHDGAASDLKKAVAYVWNGEARAAMERMIQDVRPDIVHLHNIYHHLSSSILEPVRQSGVPCVQTLHDYKLACPNYKMFTQGKICERCRGGKYGNAIKYRCLDAAWAPNALAAFEMCLSKAAQSYERTVKYFICPSRFMKEKMEDWGEPPSKLTVVPNPGEVAAAPAERGGGYVLYSGRLSPEKGLASFIEAAALIPELPVKIAGLGPEAERLRSLAASYTATNIEFLGFVAPEELTRLRRRAEAVVLPTVMYENASGALLEAMGDGLPCLATRVGGNPELIEDGVNGFLANAGEAEDWLRILRRFLAAPAETRREMGERGREKVRANHSWSSHLARLEEIYGSAVSPML